MPPRCPLCGGALRREPARVVCTSCSMQADITHATNTQRRIQEAMDRDLRARGVETKTLHPSREVEAPKPKKLRRHDRLKMTRRERQRIRFGQVARQV
jgi:uncharacterized Zn finger protein (UPF0148 family)